MSTPGVERAPKGERSSLGDQIPKDLRDLRRGGKGAL